MATITLSYNMATMITLSYDDKPTVTVYEDNQGAIEIAKNPKFHNRTKHVDIAFHFIRERIASSEIQVVYCPKRDMLADIMTKGLSKERFEKLRNLLNVYPCQKLY